MRCLKGVVVVVECMVPSADHGCLHPGVTVTTASITIITAISNVTTNPPLRAYSGGTFLTTSQILTAAKRVSGYSQEPRAPCKSFSTPTVGRD